MVLPLRPRETAASLQSCQLLVRGLKFDISFPCPRASHVPASPTVPKPQASPEGQRIFDKLLKACNEVAWKGESILVLKEICVNPPYAAGDCALIGAGGAFAGGGMNEGSLERVRKIVRAAAQS